MKTGECWGRHTMICVNNNNYRMMRPRVFIGRKGITRGIIRRALLAFAGTCISPMRSEVIVVQYQASYNGDMIQASDVLARMCKGVVVDEWRAGNGKIRVAIWRKFEI